MLSLFLHAGSVASGFLIRKNNGGIYFGVVKQLIKQIVVLVCPKQVRRVDFGWSVEEARMIELAHVLSVIERGIVVANA